LLSPFFINLESRKQNRGRRDLRCLIYLQDPQSLQDARPQIANSTCFVGLIGVNTNRFASVGMQPKTEAKETRLQSFAGNVTVSTS